MKFDELKTAWKGKKAELTLMLAFVAATAGTGIYRYVQDRPAPEPETKTEAEVPVQTESETEMELYQDVLPKEEDGTEMAGEETELVEEAGAKADTKAGAPASKETASQEEEAADETETETEETVFAVIPWNVLRDTDDAERILFPMETRSQLWYLRRFMPDGAERALSGQLETHLNEILEEATGDWSVWVKNLKTGKVISVGEQPMKSASVMKLFILGTVYQAIENGELERTDTLVSQMKNMISYSDNEGSNRLLYLLGDEDYEKGIERVNTFIRDCGFSEMTIEYNGFNNSAVVYDEDHFNQVSAADCGKLLEAIYRREWGSRSISNEIEQMMINQQTRNKIPAGLPDGVVCGNKTGEMDKTENDAAIIYGKRCDYILVVLSSDWATKDEAVSRIRRISSLVYNYLEEKEPNA